MALKRQKAPWAKLAHVQHAQQRLSAACSAPADSSPATSPWASSCSCRDLHITQSFSCPRFPLMRVASHSHDDVTASLGGVDVVKHCAVFFSHAHLDALLCPTRCTVYECKMSPVLRILHQMSSNVAFLRLGLHTSCTEAIAVSALALRDLGSLSTEPLTRGESCACTVDHMQ